MIYSHIEMSRKIHLSQVLHIFRYLKKHHNSDMVFDPTDPDIDSLQFERQYWDHCVYGDFKEDLITDIPDTHVI